MEWGWFVEGNDQAQERAPTKSLSPWSFAYYCIGRSAQSWVARPNFDRDVLAWRGRWQGLGNYTATLKSLNLHKRKLQRLVWFKAYNRSKESIKPSRGNHTGDPFVPVNSVARDLGFLVFKIARDPEEIVVVYIFIRGIFYYFLSAASYSWIINPAIFVLA